MEEILTRTAKIFIDENNILHIVNYDGVHLDYEDAIDNALVIKRLTKGEKVLKFVDARGRITIDKKARHFIEQVDLKRTIARAVLINSFVSNLLLIFFRKLNRSEIPTKIFYNYEEAYNWLLNFKKNSFTTHL